MNENIKLYSEIEEYEIINVNDGERYSSLSNNDILIDDDGKLKVIIIKNPKAKFNFFSKNEVLEIPWNCVKKIGAKTIIIDADENEIDK